ncbi:MAG: UDP-N-acetylglucosamine 2-epimerase (non-hydrolyzing) [Proteobacteria bacterium]|nr:UDP-N-acetylglucosamine 2-epimerase (non-hydrolyzing) [Pseudomonadota bacterium]
MKNKIAIIIGTRPEIIKTAPVIKILDGSEHFQPVVIFTGQHQSMAFQAFQALNILPDYNLNVMKEGQTPTELISQLLPSLENVLKEINPVGAIVQGDTTSALAGAISAFHLKIPLAHIEAGLRTNNFSSPFPEEMNRCLISKMTNLHFCPTELGEFNLRKEGFKENTFVVGNTVVDSLKLIQPILEKKIGILKEVDDICTKAKKILLVTGHRRESFEQPLRNLCKTLANLANDIPDLHIIYPLHLNPHVYNTVSKELKSRERVHLLEPLDYINLLYVLKNSSLVVTDSGGIQEEAPSFGVRVLVTRNITERPEAIQAGCSEIISLLDANKLYQRAYSELTSPSDFPKIKGNPYGDGTAANKILSILETNWSANETNLQQLRSANRNR